ncbi:erythromycin esterase family protein [Arcicella rosea]|uniref:Erythromycin esterase n=1 Tax=Arcicella rosea TaxID=502909 RepID=A0A841ENW8_9BACT|nr:erythromycin esterase family protein [Arcicella rosea]MBB6004935.1 erythromycin esterase [Arcicella rosea]
MRIKLILITSFLIGFQLFGQKTLPVHALNLEKPALLQKQLKPIIDKIGNKRIVALGEGTHGTKEFNEIRIALIKELVEKKGFNLICFENAFGNSYYLNQMINSDRNIQQAIRENITSVWQTKEIESLLLWMRQYNKIHSDKIEFTGMDWNYIEYSAKIVLDELKSTQNKALISFAESLYKNAKEQDKAWNAQNDSTIKLNMEEIVKNATDGHQIVVMIDSLISKNPKQYSNTLKNALLNCKQGFHVLYKAGMSQEAKTRDEMMAEMVSELAKQSGENKMVIFAHNGHIAYKASDATQKDSNPGGMGSYLKRAFSNQYYAIGTATAKGTYSATSDFVDTHDNQYKKYTLIAPLPNSWEHLLKNEKQHSFFIETKNTKSINKRLKIRQIGYRPEDKDAYTEETKLSDYFDGLIFIRNTTESNHKL